VTTTQRSDQRGESPARHDVTRADRVRACLEQVGRGRANDGFQGLFALVREDPSEPLALHAVGVAALHTGDTKTAEQFVARACDRATERDEPALAARFRIDLAQILSVTAHRLDSNARLADAETVYRRITTIDPTNVAAWRRLVAIGLAHGDTTAVAIALERFLVLRPQDPDARVAAAELEYLSGQANQANASEASLQRAIAHLDAALYNDLAHCEAGILLGALLNQSGARQAAIEQLTRTAALNSKSIPVRFELGRLLALSGRVTEAEKVLTDAAALQSTEAAERAPILALSLAQRYDEAHAAIDARFSVDPDDIHAAYLRAVVLEHQRKPSDAAYWFSRVIDIDPSQLTASARWAFRLTQLGASDASVNVLRRVLLRWPEFSVGRVQSELALPPIYPDSTTLEAKRNRFIEGLARLHRDPPRFGHEDAQLLTSNFWLAYQGRNDRDQQISLAQSYVLGCPALSFTAPHVARRTQRPRLRVGLLSAFFSNHVTTRMYRGLIEHLDRKRFEVFVIHSCDGRRDAVTKEVSALADHSLYLPASLNESQRALAQLELDVLFYPDVGMSHDNYFLAFGRYARVQCTSWGHPVTSGITAIDYYISSDRLEIAGAEAHYSERLVRFANLPTYYHRPQPVPAYDRSKLGLPDNARLYACLQSLFKFHPDFDAAIARVLRADPNAHIVTLAGERDTWSSLLRTRWQTVMPDCMDRIKFIPHVDNSTYVALLRSADVLLDTFPFAGGNTTYQAIAVGAPLVTLPSDLLRGRCSLGAYDQIGFHGLVARDEKHYAELAVRVANDRDFRTQCLNAIADGAPRLFERMDSIEEFNEFFTSAYEASFKEGPHA
jgi:protein O-GlcNAc transferase